MRLANYHTHTCFSDGVDTPRDCIVSAKQKGLAALGITDHSFTPYDLSYCMRPETHMERYEQVIREEQKRANDEGFPVYLGIEWDAGSVVERERYDYTIGAVHYILKDGNVYPIDSGLDLQKECIQKEFHGSKLDYMKYYCEEVVEHARQNCPDVIAHFDLPVKYSYFDEDNPLYRKVILEAMRETVKYVPIFEINAGAMARGLRTVPYPNPVFLKDLRDFGAHIILSSDAHKAENVDFAFEQMLSLIKEAGFESLMYFENGTFRETPITKSSL